MSPEELAALLNRARAEGRAAGTEETLAGVRLAQRRADLRASISVDGADPYRRTYTGRRSFVPLAQDATAKIAGVCPPVFPNAGVAAWYDGQLRAVLDEMQAAILPAIRKIYGESEPLLGLAADAPSRATLLQRALEKWGGLWVGKLDKLSLDLADKFADKAFTVTETMLKASFRAGGLSVKFKPTAASKEAYKAVAAENVALIKSIPAQYAKDVQAQVWASVQKGGDLHALTEGLKAKHGVSQRRAELIARDQNAKAKAVIENVRRKELGIKKAIWMHSHAGKEPRETHVRMNGKSFSLAKGMYDSAVKKWILPGEEINCRCVSRAVIPGFE